jgi:hypothetical protein
MEWKKSDSACLEWLGIVKVVLCLTGMAWNGGSQYWLHCWLGIKEVSFGLTGMARNGRSQLQPVWNGLKL